MGTRDVARILVCEDSRAYAEALTAFLECDRDLRVVGRARSGEEALGLLPRLRPDLLIIDLELPGADGIATVERIMSSQPLPILVLSGHLGRGSERAVAAIGAGALDARPKTDISLSDTSSAASVAFRRYVKRLSRSRPPGQRARRGSAPPAIARPPASVIGIAASTGGPPALEAVLGALPAGFPIPVLVVQHISPGFLGGMLRWLDAQIALPVGEARGGVPARPGVWFAPDGAHLIVDDDLKTRFDAQTVAGHHMPSADVLFASLASHAGPAAVAVVLTGMGTDGAEGIGAVRAAGGLTIAQDERTSAIFGMPRAAAEHGAERVLALDRIGPALAALAVERRAG